MPSKTMLTKLQNIKLLLDHHLLLLPAFHLPQWPSAPIVEKLACPIRTNVKRVSRPSKQMDSDGVMTHWFRVRPVECLPAPITQRP